jgi:hypothetical protein
MIKATKARLRRRTTIQVRDTSRSTRAAATREDPDPAMGVRRRNLEEVMRADTMGNLRVSSAVLLKVNSVVSSPAAHLLASMDTTARHTLVLPLTVTVTATKVTPTSSSRAAGVRLAGTGRSSLRCSGQYRAYDCVEMIPDLP